MGPVITGIYVPGDRPDRFDKAVATGADLVILDLEDAVALARKPMARESVVRWLHDRSPSDRPLIEVRVNAGNGDDLVALHGVAGATIRLPKVETTGDLDVVVAVLGDCAIAALVETAAGVEALNVIARHRAVTTIALGEADLASDIGSSDTRTLDPIRSRLLVAARAAGLPAPTMSVYADIGDLDGLRADTVRGRSMGFGGRTAVHPSQVAVIADAFAPMDAELAWAREVLRVTATGAVGRLASGEMVDVAMRGRAATILARAEPR